MRVILRLGVFIAACAGVWLDAAETQAQPVAEETPLGRETRRIEEWTVHVDLRLLAEPNKKMGERALSLLEARLADIVAVVPAAPLAKIRTVPIWLDLEHGKLTGMQYHPSADWLVSHGFERQLAKGVHISSATTFIDPRHQQIQPWCVLHELAHAYHDQVLGFEDARILKAWEGYKASGHGDWVLHVDGKQKKHYALTNQKEFFAEMTEAYFGTNDFFPFVQGELRQAEPNIYELLRIVWGPSPLN